MTTIVLQASEYGSPPLIFSQSDRSLATSLHATFSEHRACFLDSVRLSEPAPSDCMTLNNWSAAANFSRLIVRYADYIYRDHPQMTRENKPLQSLWAQWYLGLLTPPAIMALLLENRALDIYPARCHVEFTENGQTHSASSDPSRAGY
ncbi:hypothetical protein LU631_22010 [Erwinia tracheiphila]|nr:hypothetical protein [Erwinia tracheiphila]UIA84194.1 hypothetical protein LU604_03765 [Erwinia tracheiphila]UIA87361.1 hypothetical protein LU631_22010 [Erwinia tracheiphila]UIA92776.1 hypothetical protein LU632_03720 [Erwinia tracheiphila]UIA95725.1 hypothetical protein LU633_20455 [Erwinia tracheiphila]